MIVPPDASQTSSGTGRVQTRWQMQDGGELVAAGGLDVVLDGADEVVCAHTPEAFSAVGQWYREFSQTADDEVRDLLRKHREWREESSKVL